MVASLKQDPLCIAVLGDEAAQITLLVPHALLTDHGPGTMDSVCACPFGQLLCPVNSGLGQAGAALIVSILDVVRKEAVGRECLQSSSRASPSEAARAQVLARFSSPR